MDLAKEKDKMELENLVSCYLSPKFLRIRELYLSELNKILTKNLNKFTFCSKKVLDINITNVKVSSVRILLPVKFLKKKLREMGVLHPFFTRPTSKLVFSYLRDYNIIN